MNRFILKNGRMVTILILTIFVWFIYRQFVVVKSPLFPFIAIAVIIWITGAFLFIYFWPAITCNAFKRAVLGHGLGSGPISINSLCIAPTTASPSAPVSSLLSTGANELLYFGGWLDLRRGPLILQVPDFCGRYYSIQLTDPLSGANFAYVGKRTTGTQESAFLITGPGWTGRTPEDLDRIASLNQSVLLLGRVFVVDESDFPEALDLAKQIKLIPFSTHQIGG
jgi:hypothetical protein